MLLGGGGKIGVLQKSFAYQTHNNKVFVSSESGLSIDVLDDKGKKLSSISYPAYKKRPFTSDDKKKMLDEMKKGNKQRYEALKNRLEFPEFYPEILNMFFANDKLYVATWKWEKDKIEFFVFTPKGKLLKHTYIPFVFVDTMQPYPAAIMDNKLYQLIENEDSEEWELHVNEIK